MKIVSIILARGGSKGIPDKNIIDLNNKPLIYYTINASKKSKVSETWISTDSKKISIIAESFGAKIIDRPKEYATDQSSSEQALKHFSTEVEFDIMVFIQPTSPLIYASDINKGLDLMKRDKYDSVFSVSKEHWLPRWSLDIKPINWSPSDRPRRQDMKEKYVENGAFYITTKEQFLQSGIRYGGKMGIVELPISRSFQIDTYEDLEILKKIL
tara:strand:- start:1577 stop:2215 length:639 start_codon:yes stop_codon:yes gene_type:complete